VPTQIAHFMLDNQNLMNLRKFFAIIYDKRWYIFWVKKDELFKKNHLKKIK